MNHADPSGHMLGGLGSRTVLIADGMRGSSAQAVAQKAASTAKKAPSTSSYKSVSSGIASSGGVSPGSTQKTAASAAVKRPTTATKLSTPAARIPISPTINAQTATAAVRAQSAVPPAQPRSAPQKTCANAAASNLPSLEPPVLTSPADAARTLVKLHSCDSGAQRVTAQKAPENGQGFWDKVCGSATKAFASIVAYGQGVVYALGQDITSSISTVRSIINGLAGPQSPDIIDPNASLGLSDISDAGVDTRPDAFGGRETAMELGEQFGHKLSLALGILGAVTGANFTVDSAIAGIAAAPATAGLSLVVSAAGVVLGVTVAGVSVALVAEAVQGIAYSVTSPAPTPAMSSQTGGGSQRPFRQEVPNPAVLRRRMRAAGIEEPEKPFAAHHIVAGKAPKAEEARAILDKFEILINDANNGVYLPTDPNANWGTYHRSLHTEKYYRKVTEALQRATTRNEAIAILQEIAELLKAGEFV